MRDILTYIGIALIVVLTVALAAPYVIDANAYRARLAAEFSAATGAHAALNGPISLRILPVPRFSADNLALSGDFGALRAKRVFFELSLPALLRGRLQFSQAELDGADISVKTEAGQKLGVVGAAAQFDHFVLHDAKLVLLRQDKPALTIDHLDLDGRAPSLAGPFSGRGALMRAGEKIAFSFGTDILAKQSLPVKARLFWPGTAGRLEVEGKLDFGAAPQFVGEAKGQGAASAGPWRAQAALSAGFDGVSAKKIEIDLGKGAPSQKITGAAHYAAAAGRIALDLAATRIDAAWAGAFDGLLQEAKASGAQIDLRLAVDSLNWRGVEWSQARLERKPGGPARLSFEAPGDSRVKLVGAWKKDVWRGRAEIKTANYAAFAAALRKVAPEAGPLANVKLGAVDLSGNLAASQGQIALTDANFALGGAHFTGDMWFRPEKPGWPALLSAHLAAPNLDLNALPDFGAEALGGVDLDLSLTAKTVKIARNGEVYGKTGRIDAHFLRNDGVARLAALELKNIGGADLSAKGSWGPDFAGLQGEARLKAEDLTRLAKLLVRVAPGRLSRLLASRARLFSPADLAAKAEGPGKGVLVKGVLGGTRIALQLSPQAEGGPSAALDLTAPEGGAVLGQLGAPQLLTQKLGPAHVKARGRPDPSRPDTLDLTAAGDLAGMRGEFHGQAVDLTGDASIAGDLALSGDLAKIMQSFGLAAPKRFPARLSARISEKDGAWRLQNLAGQWDGAKYSGDLAFGAEGMTGQLRSDRLSAPALAALVLGPPEPAKAGALWSSLSFAPVLFDPPRVKGLAVETDDLQPYGGKARFDLTLAPGRLSVDHADWQAFGGSLRGNVDLRRDAGQATLAGEAEAENLTVKNRALSATLGGKLHFAGGGGSLAKLVGSLAGEGKAQVGDLTIAGAAPSAPDEAVAANEASQEPFEADAVAQSLDQFFAKGDFHMDRADFLLRLAQGQLNFVRPAGTGPALDFTFDASDGDADLTLSIAARKLPADWREPPPRGGVRWSGPWASPVRHVLATEFVTAIAARALDREHERIEKQKAEDRARLRALIEHPPPPPKPPASQKPAQVPSKPLPPKPARVPAKPPPVKPARVPAKPLPPKPAHSPDKPLNLHPANPPHAKRPHASAKPLNLHPADPSPAAP